MDGYFVNGIVPLSRQKCMHTHVAPNPQMMKTMVPDFFVLKLVCLDMYVWLIVLALVDRCLPIADLAVIIAGMRWLWERGLGLELQAGDQWIRIASKGNRLVLSRNAWLQGRR